MTFEHLLSPRGNGAQVTHRVSFAGLLSLLFAPLVAAQLRRGLPVTMQNLKAYIEKVPE